MTQMLQTWNEAFSGLPLFDTRPKQGNAHGDDSPDGEPFLHNVAYLVEICKTMVVTSDYSGDVQLHLSYARAGYRNKSVYMTLPKQATDLPREPDRVQWLTQLRMRDIERLYASAVPGLFALYDSADESSGMKQYIDFDGKPMDDAAFLLRRNFIQQRLVETVDALHNMVGQAVRELDGAFVYLVIRPNEKNPKYPYINISRTPPGGTRICDVDVNSYAAASAKDALPF